jgi:outer membrane receptor protein involved in Fe transport
VPSGSRLPVTPKVKGSATARYTFPAWGDVKAHVQGGIAYKGSARASLRSLQLQSGTQLLVDPNAYLGKIRSSTVVDLFAGLDWPQWNLEAFVTNVFDSTDELSRGVNCGSCTRTLIVPGRPRTFGIRSGIKF